MEQRKFIRVPFKTEASYAIAGEAYTAKIEDISLHGAYLLPISPFIPHMGLKMQVKISLIGSSSKLSLQLDARVVRIDEHGFGVTFQEIDLDSFIHLKNIVTLYSGDVDWKKVVNILKYKQ